jgi:hypothetical protein
MEDSSSFNKILKKVIDYTMGIKKTTVLKINDIVKFISSSNGIEMNFSNNEILNCCKEYDKFFKIYGKKDEEIIEIEEKELNSIISKLNQNDFDLVIDEFYKNELSEIYVKQFSLKKIKESIHIFLYNLLIESEIEYNKLFLIKSEEISKFVHKVEQVDIINEFIQWDNFNKNTMIYSLYGVGMELSILSMKKDLVNITTLKKKILYLDTNVIFRLLGLNGIELQERTEVFLTKISSVGMEIRISSITKQEFDETIKQKVLFISENLKNTKKYTINSLARLDRNNYNLFQYFIDWQKNKKGIRITSLIPHIEVLLKKALKTYSIVLENKIEKGLIKKEVLEILTKEYIEQRTSCRKQSKAIEYDMKNYLYILSLRNGKTVRAFETINHYILSTDYELINFDNHNNDNFKVILHPARLYSIVLQFTGRITSTELMSFIHLVKVDVKTENKISEDTLLIINDHINDYQSDEDLQQPYIDALIESEILSIIDKVDIIEKRGMLNDIFEKVSKQKLVEEQIKSKEKDDKIKILETKALKYEKLKKIISAIVQLIILLGLIYFLYKILYEWIEKNPINPIIFSILSIISFIILIVSKAVNIIKNN